jgi:AcrR family transcriptional regulator
MNQKIANSLSARDVTPKGAARIVDIARAGTEILLEEGFSAVTKRQVAKRLGIAHGNVGYYFPTRESLWRAVVDYELAQVDDKYPSNLETSADDPQAYFDEYLMVYMVSYEDRQFRSFFAHVEAYAEINPAVAKLRDEIFEGFLRRITQRIRPLCIGVDDEQIELRAIAVFALFAGLGSVTAFRPELITQNKNFQQQMIDHANAIVRGD